MNGQRGGIWTRVNTLLPRQVRKTKLLHSLINFILMGLFSCYPLQATHAVVTQEWNGDFYVRNNPTEDGGAQPRIAAKVDYINCQTQSLTGIWGIWWRRHESDVISQVYETWKITLPTHRDRNRCYSQRMFHMVIVVARSIFVNNIEGKFLSMFWSLPQRSNLRTISLRLTHYWRSACAQRISFIVR